MAPETAPATEQSTAPVSATEAAELAELAELRRRREELQRKKPSVSTADKIAAERLELANEEAIANAEETIGQRGLKFATVFSPRGVIILKRAATPSMKKFMDADKLNLARVETLVTPCVVHPARDVADQIFDEWPGLLTECASAVVDLANGKRRETEGK